MITIYFSKLKIFVDDTDGKEMYITSDIPHMLRIDPNNLETLYKVCIEQGYMIVVALGILLQQIDKYCFNG